MFCLALHCQFPVYTLLQITNENPKQSCSFTDNYSTTLHDFIECTAMGTHLVSVVEHPLQLAHERFHADAMLHKMADHVGAVVAVAVRLWPGLASR